jgi:hypothetical protein
MDSILWVKLPVNSHIFLHSSQDRLYGSRKEMQLHEGVVGISFILAKIRFSNDLFGSYQVEAIRFFFQAILFPNTSLLLHIE